MAWMDYKYHSKDTHFRWKIKWWLELLVALRSMGDRSPLTLVHSLFVLVVLLDILLGFRLQALVSWASLLSELPH